MDVNCGSVENWLRAVRERQQKDHELLSADDPLNLRVGFCDQADDSYFYFEIPRGKPTGKKFGDAYPFLRTPQMRADFLTGRTSVEESNEIVLFGCQKESWRGEHLPGLPFCDGSQWGVAVPGL